LVNQGFYFNILEKTREIVYDLLNQGFNLENKKYAIGSMVLAI